SGDDAHVARDDAIAVGPLAPDAGISEQALRKSAVEIGCGIHLRVHDGDASEDQYAALDGLHSRNAQPTGSMQGQIVLLPGDRPIERGEYQLVVEQAFELGHIAIELRPPQPFLALENRSTQALLHIGIGGSDELPQSYVIEIASGPELHMAHELARAFQQAFRIGNLGTSKESDVDVSFEGVHVNEGGPAYAGSRMPIMQQLSNIVSASADDLEPVLRDRA